MTDNNKILFWIIAGVFVWGTVLAVGAYLFNYLPARFFVVMACVDGFLAFWLVMLWFRRGREKAAKPPNEPMKPIP